MGLAENLIAQKMGEKRVQSFLKKNPALSEKIKQLGIEDTSNISSIDDLLSFTSKIDTALKAKTPEEELALKAKEKKALTEATKSAERTAKLRQLTGDLENAYFPIADLVPTSDSDWLGRKQHAAKLWIDSKQQQTPTGVAAANLEGLNKRLRVSLVRAAGDVGNLNIVEQKAAEMLLFRYDDSTNLREMKKAVLQDLSKGIKAGDSSKVKDLINKWTNTSEYKQTIEESGVDAPYEFDSLEEAEKAGLPKGAIVRLPNGKLKKYGGD